MSPATLRFILAIYVAAWFGRRLLPPENAVVVRPAWGAVGKQAQLLFLDTVLHLSAAAVGVFGSRPF
jgi:hypothetical protein